ncbi:hypothetical protein TrST_g10634 [Triparma strigata]|uniref:YbaK/aminoacyl-tRNA synthetase-associated domain-containing protein n=1 Tax=Triparma strigata TaxID=1606541 RepID=A0A9W7B3H6_9STRA|nr:hypothetical protein TrST_g10634 [Triparma strigata]
MPRLSSLSLGLLLPLFLLFFPQTQVNSLNLPSGHYTATPIPLTPTLTLSIYEASPLTQNTLVETAIAGSPDLPHDDPYGCVLWPASYTISKHFISKIPHALPLKILELGSGTGLASLTASHYNHTVLSTDYSPLPLDLLYHSAISQNLNLDMKLFDITSREPLPSHDVLIAADVMYEPKTGRALAERVVESYKNKGRVIVGDSPGRMGRPAFLERLEELREGGMPEVVFREVEGRTVEGYRDEMICGKGSGSVGVGGKVEVAVLDWYKPGWGEEVVEEKYEEEEEESNVILNKLKSMKIDHTVHSHPPAFTSAELEEYAGSLGRHTKNLFAVSKKIGLVLVCARAEADTNFKGLGTKMGIKGGFSMAKEEVLERVLNVKKGSVGPMSIVNDSEKEVRFILDAGIMDLERVFSHPGRNDFSVGMKPEDLVKYIESTGRSVELIDFDMKEKE